MSVEFEYPKKFTFSQIKTKTKSDKPVVRGIKNYLFRLKTNFEGISINPSDGVITINKKAVPGNYILEIDCVDSVTNKCFPTKHIVFVRDPNTPFPGDDEFSGSEEEEEDNNINNNNNNINNNNNKNNNKNKKLVKKVKKDKKKVLNNNFFEKLKNKILSNNKSAVTAVVAFAISAITLLSD